MIDSVLLYLTSAMVQVWSALLIYQIFDKQGRVANLELSLERLWGLAREWWHQPLRKMVDPNAPSIRTTLNAYGITEVQVRTAEADIDSFVSVIKAIRTHNLINIMNVSFSDTAKIRHVSPSDGQIILSAIAANVETVESDLLKMRNSNENKFSFVGIGFNLLTLCSLALVTSENTKFFLNLFVGMVNALLLIFVFFKYPKGNTSK